MLFTQSRRSSADGAFMIRSTAPATKLRLAEWASLAEVVSAIAVVISLIYVGIQIRDNTEAIRAANRQQLSSRAHNAIITIATSAKLSESFGKAANNRELTPTEQIQYGFFVRSMSYDVQESFLLHKEERLDEGYWMTRGASFERIRCCKRHVTDESRDCRRVRGSALRGAAERRQTLDQL